MCLLIDTHLCTSILRIDLLSPEKLILKLLYLFILSLIGAVLAFFVKAIRRAVLALCINWFDLFSFLALFFLLGFD